MPTLKTNRLNISALRKLGFWLPQRDETIVDVRSYGRKVLTIEHRDYPIKARPDDITAEAGL